MRLVLALLLVACAREAAPVNLGESASIGALPSASAAPTPAPGADTLSVLNDALVVPPIFYRVGSDQLLPDSEKILQLVVDFMSARRDVRLLRVEVHTDSTGSSSYNAAMSQKRATTVARWLIDHGVDCSRLDAVGYGEARPLAPNSTEEGRAKNRRTAFVIATNATPSQGLCP